MKGKKTFVNAFLYGYTIEKEKLYIVEIPNPNSGIEHKHIALARLANGKLGFSEIIDTDFYQEKMSDSPSQKSAKILIGHGERGC
ncbi:DUF1642 domain-containing protein [Streptococcus equi]|uniref:DUF1642 domain-containing protein n=1 Tax=Streptococcus equi TaxID=1336 RepID=UPI001E2C224E|nr:DUF1642 domain-containing protein [Streptococcus equi]